jgi:flagellar protein FliL
MNKTVKIALGLTIGAATLAAAGGTGFWLGRRAQNSDPHKAGTTAVQPDTREYKYIGLDKIIVMLRRPQGDNASHYLAMDLVFKAPLETETVTRDQLPLLRSIAVKDLSTMTVESANNMSIDELTARLNKAFAGSYAPRHIPQPFSEAMIGKLVVE